jgi:ribosomal protein S12 methylthiotransferase accessory factor
MAPLQVDYLNERVELFDAIFDDARRHEYRAVSRLYNRQLGPVHALVVHRPEATDFSMFASGASHVPVGALLPNVLDKPRDVNTIVIPGAGKGGEMQKAVLGGLGEISERLLALMHYASMSEREFIFGTWEELARQGVRALHPRELPLFAPEQYDDPAFPYAPFEPTTRVAWIEGRALATAEPVFAPAQLILLYYRRRPGEPAIAYPTTGGLVFHSSPEAATLHGLYEVIERDAINVCWHSRIPPRRVRIDLTDALVRTGAIARPRLRVAGLDEVHVLLNTVDVPIPVLTAIALDHSKTQKAYLGGGGAWSTKDRALIQTIFELGQCRNTLKYHKPVQGKHIRHDSPLHELSDFFDSVIYYGYEQNIGKLDWYLMGGAEMEWSEVVDNPWGRAQGGEELANAISLCERAGLSPIVFDMSGACWDGVHVQKVLIPELTHAGVPATPFLGHPRFLTVPRAMGLTDRVLTFNELNPDPVPLP